MEFRSPMALVTFLTGVATVVLAALVVPEGEARVILLVAGGFLLGNPTKGPGLMTKSSAERLSSRPPPRG